MAYIGKEQAAKIRKELKELFPQFKFSVRIADHRSLNVAIMAGPIDFRAVAPHAFRDESYYCQINRYHIENTWEGAVGQILRAITDVCNRDNYDNSDIQTDYFDVGYYFHLKIGKWDRDYEVRN